MHIFFPVILFLIGVFLSFFGYKYLKKTLMVMTFLIVTIGLYFLINLVVKEISFGVFVGILVAALIATAGVSFFFDIGIFFVSFFVSVGFYVLITEFYRDFSFELDKILPLFIAGIFGGVLSIIFRKHLLIIITSLVGTFITVLSLIFFINFEIFIEQKNDFSISSLLDSFKENTFFIFISFLFIFIISILYQYSFINKPVVFLKSVFFRSSKDKFFDNDTKDVATISSLENEFDNIKSQKLELSSLRNPDDKTFFDKSVSNTNEIDNTNHDSDNLSFKRKQLNSSLDRTSNDTK